jgi:RNA polymerase sigma-70 factor (ECF subfamily)
MDGSSKTLELLHTHSGWLRRLACGLLRDSDEAEDVVQESMVAAWKKPPALDRDVRPWLAEVVRNRARDQARGRRRRDSRELAAEELSARSVENPEELLERFQLHKMLTEVVLALEEPFRQTLLLRFFEGLSSAAIAERLGTPAGTIRWRLKEGLERVRRELDRRHDGQRAVWVRSLLPWVTAPGLPLGLGGGESAAPATGSSSAAMQAAGGIKVAKLAGAAALAGLAVVGWRLTTSAPPPVEPTAPVSAAQSLMARARNVPRLTVAGGGPGAEEPDRASSAACQARAKRTEAEMRVLEGELRNGDMDFAFEFGEPDRVLEEKLRPQVEEILLARGQEVIAQRFACRRLACRLLLHVQRPMAAETVMVVHHLAFEVPPGTPITGTPVPLRGPVADPRQSCDDSLSILEQELAGLRARKQATLAADLTNRRQPPNPELDHERQSLGASWRRLFHAASFRGGQCHREEGRPLFCRMRWDVPPV